MKKQIMPVSLLLVALAMVAAYALGPVQAAMGKNKAHAHIGHVMTGWNDTPGGKGLLPTAIGEAKIAARHATFAANKTSDLAWMKTHTRHVLHAVDPNQQGKGPGMGYGVLKAASGAVKHIGFAAGSEGASGNVKAHAVHVATSANNSAARVKEIVALGKKILAANDAAQAAPLVRRMQRLAMQLLDGKDANGDGKITWKEGEGGLAEASKHMGFMLKGEGLN